MKLMLVRGVPVLSEEELGHREIAVVRLLLLEHSGEHVRVIPHFRAMTFLISFCIGGSSLAAQFAYNRLIFFYVANSEYVAATIISLHLLGFLIGTLLGKRLTCPIGLLLGAAAVSTVAAYLLVWSWGVAAFGLLATLSMTVGFSLLNALLAGWALVRLMQSENDKQSTRIVIADSAGSVLGAVVAGFILVPQFGLDVTFGAAFTFQLVALALYFGHSPSWPCRRWIGVGVTGVIALLAVSFAHRIDPPASKLGVVSQGFQLALNSQSKKDILLSERSPFGLVNVIRPTAIQTQDVSSATYLFIDSRALCTVVDHMTSQMAQSEWAIGAHAAHWISAVRHTPRITIIGLGCGVTLAAALKEGRTDPSVETVEINPVMAKAAKLFEPIVGFTLDDPRHTLTIDDGFRHFSQSEGGTLLDAVVLDVAWMQNMNATHLFSREMFANVRKRLAPNGIFIVWSEEFDPFSETSQIIYRTLQEIFPIVRAQQEADGAVVFFATAAHKAEQLDAILKPETKHLNRWLMQTASDAPINTLDDLAMNRSKFTWFGDSLFDRLFEKYAGASSH